MGGLLLPVTGVENAAGRGIATETVGGLSHLTDTGSDLEVGQAAERGSVVVGRRRGTGGPTDRG